MRIRAALGAFDRAGVETNVDAVDQVFEHSFGETRPCELNAAVTRAAVLADQTPVPQLAALIAVAVLALPPPRKPTQTCKRRAPTPTAAPRACASPPGTSGWTTDK